MNLPDEQFDKLTQALELLLFGARKMRADAKKADTAQQAETAKPAVIEVPAKRGPSPEARAKAARVHAQHAAERRAEREALAEVAAQFRAAQEARWSAVVALVASENRCGRAVGVSLVASTLGIGEKPAAVMLEALVRAGRLRGLTGRAQVTAAGLSGSNGRGTVYATVNKEGA